MNFFTNLLLLTEPATKTQSCREAAFCSPEPKLWVSLLLNAHLVVR